MHPLATLSRVSTDLFTAERFSLIPTLMSSEAILFSENDSPKEQGGESIPAPFLTNSQPLSPSEYDSPTLDEESTPRPAPSSTIEPISPPENTSIELDEESTPRFTDFNNLGSVSSSENNSTGQVTLCEPEPSFVPPSESDSGDLSKDLASQAIDLTPSLEQIPLTNCDLPESPVEQDATSKESLVVADSNKSIALLSAITGLNPSKSSRASQPNTVKTASMREDESVNFIKQLDDFAVFFGVEKPSKITPMAPLKVQAKLGCTPDSDTSSLPTAGHNDNTPSSPTCGHLEMVESYKREIGYLDQIQGSLEKSLARAIDENSKLLEEREMLTEEFNQLQWNFEAEQTKNAKLERILHTMKSDHIRIFTRQDWELNQLKRFNAAMVDLKLHAPVLFNANHAVRNGQPADAALIAAIKEAATKFGSPWAEILPAIVGDCPDEIYHEAMQRCAKLEGDRRAATKKYLFWKMKAQMDPRHAKYVTPSSSSMSLVLDSCLPEETLELNGVNNLLAKLKTAKVPRCSQPAASSTVVAGSSRSEGAHVASGEPSKDVPFKAPVASSLIPGESNVPVEAHVASSPILISEEPSEDECYEARVASSPILISEEPSKDELYEAPAEPSEDVSSESVTITQLESSLVIMPSPALSGRSSCTCEAPARVIRHYIPGLALFGEDGSGLAPPGLFDRDEHEDLPESPVLSHSSSPAKSISVSMARNYVVDHIEHASVSRFTLSYHYYF